MKKIMSALAASVMAVASLPVFSASATVEENALSIDTEVLTEDYTTADGTVIPAGATAVTINVSYNTGFCSTMTTLDIGDSDVIVNEDDKPVYEIGDVVDDSLVSSSQHEGIVAFASASAEENTEDGSLFTFYVTNFDSVVIVYDEMLSGTTLLN